MVHFIGQSTLERQGGQGWLDKVGVKRYSRYSEKKRSGFDNQIVESMSRRFHKENVEGGGGRGLTFEIWFSMLTLKIFGNLPVCRSSPFQDTHPNYIHSNFTS